MVQMRVLLAECHVLLRELLGGKTVVVLVACKSRRWHRADVGHQFGAREMRRRQPLH